ncbi:MAG: sigma-54 dependent transcriptional regulator [Myxococcaceae bacterium]
MPNPRITGSSRNIQEMLSILARVSRFKTNVLLLGESGVGKELVARALHDTGPRSKRDFVPLNCAALNRELLENELFGHEKGAFTGATERKKGLFEHADGGTLFLDEIGEMDPATQAKLLRVLERGEFRRVGGIDKVRADVSVIAATNHDLTQAIATGRFRRDLYYRLKVVTLHVSPLRARKGDIPELVESFVDEFNARNGTDITGVSPKALKLLTEHDWPGNVRELRNAVESAAILSTGPVLGPELFALERVPAATALAPRQQTLAQAQRELIEATVARTATREEAAGALGIGLRTLYAKLRQYEKTAKSA